MKVVLLENVRGLGRIGDVKNVADGHAKNYLFPNKLAQPAHSFLVGQIENLKRKSGLLAEKEAINAQEIIKLVANPEFVLEIKSGRTNKEGKLYAAIGLEKVSAALKERGLKINPENIQIENPIKSVGDHEIGLDFGDNMKTTLRLRVQP